MLDQELAHDIAEMKTIIVPETGKPMGLRMISEQLGISYGKARYVDNKYNKVVDKYHPPVESDEDYDIPPVVTYTWDLETTNLNTFMGQLIVASFLDMATGEIDTRSINDFKGRPAESERQLIEWTVNKIKEADILIGHNTLGYDMGFLRGRIAIHGLDLELPKRQHWDTYQIARHGFKGKPQGYSLENLLDFFRVPVGKDKPSKHDWAASIILDEEAIDRLVVRCEMDVTGNALLWPHLRKWFHSWKGR